MSTADLVSKAYRHLHGRLVSGDLLPGAVLSEKKLADELGISRTPVGEAVRRLASEGLVQQVPRYGTVVKEITRSDIEEIYELREAIEPYAARKAAVNISKTQLEQLAVLCRAIERLAEKLDNGDAEALEGEDLRQFLAADMAFHLLIVRAAMNSRILKTVQDSRVVSQLFRIRRHQHDSVLVHSACEHHRRILTALQSGDGDAAGCYVLDHISESKSETLRFIDRELSIRSQPETTVSLELSDELREELERLEQG